MKKIVLHKQGEQKSYYLDGDSAFSIPVGALTTGLTQKQGLILNLGIAQFSFALPTGRFRFQDSDYEITGFYNDVRICLDHNDKNIEFGLSSPSGVVKLRWWPEQPADKDGNPRVVIQPEINNDYNAALHCYLSLRCNFNCDYCFIPTEVLRNDPLEPIRTQRFLEVLHETGKTFNIIFSGGEPFIIPNLVEACAELTKKHYISIVTNLSLTKRIKDFVKAVDCKRVQYMVCSFQAHELEKRNMVNTFMENYRLLKNAGFGIHAQIVAYPPVLKDLEKYLKLFHEKDLEVICAPFIGRYNNRSYPGAYSNAELKLIRCERQAIKTSYNWKNKSCIAGYNNGLVNSKHDVLCCINIKNKIGNIYEKINFSQKMIKCPHEFCSVPLSIENYSLHQAALHDNA
ncbi:MAG: radical SAM protein [Spirochaetales bacterium]|nr:radical SAM protein [Spirochaetales bacterium]